jgi:hypothetical protein
MFNQEIVLTLVLVLVTIGLIIAWAKLASHLLKTAVTNKYIAISFIVLTLAGIFWFDALGTAFVGLQQRSAQWTLSMDPDFVFRAITDFFWTTSRILGIVGVIVLIIGVILDLTASRKKKA